MLGDPVRLIVQTTRIARVDHENRLMCSMMCSYLCQLNGGNLCSLDTPTALDGLFRHGGCLKAEELAATEPQG